MPLVWDLISDNNSVEGKLVTTTVIVAIAIVVGTVVGRVWSRRVDDRYRKYYARKIVHYVVVAVTLIGLGILWRPFAGQLGLVLGLVAAGIAIGLQDLIGSLAGWFNIQSGSIFRVGDRVDVGGVQGDVIDISPVRTKIMEIGSGLDDDTWVRGRQYTGRIVAIANKATFVDPVFNYERVVRVHLGGGHDPHRLPRRLAPRRADHDRGGPARLLIDGGRTSHRPHGRAVSPRTHRS